MALAAARRSRAPRPPRARRPARRSSARIPTDGGVVVRAFRPAAASVTRRRRRASDPVALERVHPGGVFEGVDRRRRAAARLPARGRLRRRPARSRSTIRTASCRRSASSTCTWSARAATRSCGSGSARTCARSTASRGTAFAVWAPAARAVSVVGDFNYWDGRMHPMRSLGSSGVWELFLPGVGAGARYKYEILAPDGEIRLKADPVAFADRGAAEDRLGRARAHARVGRRGVARAAPRERAARAARCRSTRSTSARGG